MQEPTISVRGVGNVSAPPDMTVISFEMSALNYMLAPDIEPEDVEARDTVTVIWELVQALPATARKGPNREKTG